MDQPRWVRWLIAGLLGLGLIGLCVAIVGVTLFINLPGTIRLGDQDNHIAAEATEEFSYPVGTPATLELDSPFGDIEITGGDGDTIEVTAHKKAWAVNTTRAEEALKNVQVVGTQTGDDVQLVVKHPTTRIQLNQSVEVDFTIRVPRQTTVIVRTSSGEVALTGTEGKADLDASFGSVQVRQVRGGVAVRSSSGAVTVRDLQPLASGDGDLTIRAEFGKVTLETIDTQKLTVESSSGSVQLDDVRATGDVELKSDFGDITYRNGSTGNLTIRGSSAKVELETLEVQGDLAVNTEFGNVTLQGVNAENYDVQANSGSIRLEGAQGHVKLRSSFGDIDVKQGKNVDLDLDSQSGKISFQGSLGDGPHILHTDFGSIQITLPESTGFDFDLQSDFGEIELGFPFSIDGKPDEKHWQGRANDGGASLSVSTQSGSIQVQPAAVSQ